MVNFLMVASISYLWGRVVMVMMTKTSKEDWWNNWNRSEGDPKGFGPLIRFGGNAFAHCYCWIKAHEKNQKKSWKQKQKLDCSFSAKAQPQLCSLEDFYLIRTKLTRKNNLCEGKLCNAEVFCIQVIKVKD